MPAQPGSTAKVLNAISMTARWSLEKASHQVIANGHRVGSVHAHIQKMPGRAPVRKSGKGLVIAPGLCRILFVARQLIGQSQNGQNLGVPLLCMAATRRAPASSSP